MVALTQANTRSQLAFRSDQAEHVALAGCQNHALADDAEDFARLEIVHDANGASFHMLRGEMLADAADDGAILTLAVVHRQANQLIAAFHGFGLDHFDGEQTNFGEVVVLDHSVALGLGFGHGFGYRLGGGGHGLGERS